MAKLTLREHAVVIREMVPQIENSAFLDAGLIERLNRAVKEGGKLIDKGRDSDANGEFRRALEELSACLRRCESRLLERKMYVAAQLRHMRNVNEWTRSSADTL